MEARFALLVIAASVIGAVSVHAAQNEKSPPAQSAQMQHGQTPRMDDKQMAQMQERMKEMQSQMERVYKTKDPDERRKLMLEHMESMNQGMKMMRGMGGGMMMGMMGGKSGGMGSMMGDGGKPVMDPKQRQDMMEKRIDMMHMMMEQMMQHQQMMQSPSGS